jgi:hypothetical protein
MSYMSMMLMGSFVVMLGCRSAPQPNPTQLPPCSSAAVPECQGTCPFPGQTCFNRPGYPTCTCL